MIGLTNFADNSSWPGAVVFFPIDDFLNFSFISCGKKNEFLVRFK